MLFVFKYSSLLKCVSKTDLVFHTGFNEENMLSIYLFGLHLLLSQLRALGLGALGAIERPWTTISLKFRLLRVSRKTHNLRKYKINITLRNL